MILVDTSVWVDHLRRANAALIGLLEAGRVLMHPFVIGELALGHLRNRAAVLRALSHLPRAEVASDAEVLRFIELHRVFGWGVGYGDAHLLAAVKLTAGSRLWTEDRRLGVVAAEMGLAMAG